MIFWLLRAEFDNVRDGIVYGALVGVGFNWFEAALYVAQGYTESGVAPYGAQLGSRYALFGLGGHAMTTGIFGAFLGIAMQTHRRWIRILAPIVGLVLAIAAHIVHNALPLARGARNRFRRGGGAGRDGQPDMGFLQAFVSSTLLELTIFLPFLLITALALWRSCVRERRVICEELAGEIGRTVSAGEYVDIVADDMLITRRIDPKPDHAPSAAPRSLYRRAFAGQCGISRNPDRDSLAVGWREEIWRLRVAV